VGVKIKRKAMIHLGSLCVLMITLLTINVDGSLSAILKVKVKLSL
jgi:hypothetical protein